MSDIARVLLEELSGVDCMVLNPGEQQIMLYGTWLVNFSVDRAIFQTDNFDVLLLQDVVEGFTLCRRVVMAGQYIEAEPQYTERFEHCKVVKVGPVPHRPSMRLVTIECVKDVQTIKR